MTDIPQRLVINEEGPREGFQIEQAQIATSDKVRFIEALARTGVRKIDCVSFVNPARVPGMADADAVARAIRRKPGIRYTGLWLSTKGLERALQQPLDVVGAVRLTASETFARKNTGMGHAETLAEQRRWLDIYARENISLELGYVMTAFGCNYEGPVPTATVVAMVRSILELAEEHDADEPRVYLADTVGHASPSSIARTISAVREVWPDLRLGLHLHDTRGLGLANAWTAINLGVDHFDATCGGLGGCPFAGHAGAAGNISTDELAFLCMEEGIETGIDLDALLECAHMAEQIIGHRLPSKLIRGGLLRDAKRRAAVA